MENKTYNYSPHFTWKELQCIFDVVSNEYKALNSFDDKEIKSCLNPLAISKYYQRMIELEFILLKLEKMGVNKK